MAHCHDGVWKPDMCVANYFLWGITTGTVTINKKTPEPHRVRRVRKTTTEPVGQVCPVTVITQNKKPAIRRDFYFTSA